jgi:hypothetical protein
MESMGSDVRQQGSMNRSRTDGQGVIVNWYEPINKEMALAPGASVNSTYAFVCAAYCPEEGAFYSLVEIGDEEGDPVFDLGAVKISQQGPAAETKTCEHFQWTETLFHTVPMEQTDFYVDMSTTPPTPFYSSAVIEPFGSRIGLENSSYFQYTPGDMSTYFDIDPASISSCPMSDQCQQSKNLPRALRNRVRYGKSYYDLAREKAQAGDVPPTVQEPAEKGTLRAGNTTLPTFAKDFTAYEASAQVINQGGTTSKTGDTCCSVDVPQCQVQTSALEGTRYFDYSNQRVRFEDKLSGQTIVYLFGTEHKEILVNMTAGVETCQEYCPIDPQEPLYPMEMDPEAVDMGPATIKGVGVEKFEYYDTIFKVIKMETFDFYVDISGSGDAKPVFKTSVLTPFGGPPIGTSNETFTQYVAGPPPASKFQIAGLDICPMSSNCGSSTFQSHRLAAGRHAAFYKHHFTPEAKHGVHQHP